VVQITVIPNVPVRIVNLSDAEALEAQPIENSQRRDVHPLWTFDRSTERLETRRGTECHSALPLRYFQAESLEGGPAIGLDVEHQGETNSLSAEAFGKAC
jgi:hypothetical protein